MTYIALLRGINVGGNNIIKMVALRDCFEEAGYANVTTYIQSGNVIFTYKKTALAQLELNIEKMLQSVFDYSGLVVVLSLDDLRQIVVEAPAGFGTKPDSYRYDVIFPKRPLSPTDAVRDIPTHPTVDSIVAGRKAVYFSREIENVTKSKLGKLAGYPIYKQITIRNWNTTQKLSNLTH
jgi:uncharacterized protein (DUF1697 family)